MAGTIISTTGTLYDQDTGERRGYINPITGDEAYDIGLGADDTALLDTLRGSFAFGNKDAFGRITAYAKAGVPYTVSWSNAAARQPTNFVITRTSDNVVMRTGTIDADGYPTVIS